VVGGWFPFSADRALFSCVMLFLRLLIAKRVVVFKTAWPSISLADLRTNHPPGRSF
jgi:hypothetical protein